MLGKCKNVPWFFPVCDRSKCDVPDDTEDTSIYSAKLIFNEYDVLNEMNVQPSEMYKKIEILSQDTQDWEAHFY